MNSEELELSLRSEFENYLKDVIAEMKGEVSDFRKQIEAEFDAQKTRIDEAFEGFAERFDSERKFDAGFTDSVIEHLRLSRDEGAKITAAAIAEAEELEKASMPTANFSELKSAINDISSKDSQATILKALISHAANYAPRGAFFIIKSDNFTGWKVFGKEADEENSPVRDIMFPTANDTVLGKAVASLSTAEGSYGTYHDDADYLEALNFGRPDRMYAIPLVARGRGVAVLYADYGIEGVNVNLDALETLVKIAGLTVELLASARQPAAIEAPSYAVPQPDGGYEAPADTSSFQFSDSVTYDASSFAKAQEEEAPAAEAESEYSYEVERNAYDEERIEEPSYSYDAPAVEESVPEAVEESSHEPAQDYSFETVPSYSSFDPNSIPETNVEAVEPEVEHEAIEVSHYDAAPEVVTESYDASSFESVPTVPVEEVVEEPVSHSFEAAPFDATPSEPVVPVVETPVEEKPAVSTTRSRLSDRHIDLPVEVNDDERRFHTDARRFAKLLVSEIKLYNQETVAAGRESGDLYDRLKEAIDRSREMYDNRVLPIVAAKFDYFHYELVNSLAEGQEEKLGAAYAGVHA